MPLIFYFNSINKLAAQVSINIYIYVWIECCCLLNLPASSGTGESRIYSRASGQLKINGLFHSNGLINAEEKSSTVAVNSEIFSDTNTTECSSSSARVININWSIVNCVSARSTSQCSSRRAASTRAGIERLISF